MLLLESIWINVRMCATFIT